MRIFISKDVRRAARRSLISDNDLRAAVLRADHGLIDADLGHGLIKQRIARENRGRSSGFRTIVFYRRGNVAIFIHLFAKNAQANVTARHQRALEQLAKDFARISKSGLSYFEQSDHWDEIAHDASHQTEVP